MLIFVDTNVLPSLLTISQRYRGWRRRRDFSVYELTKAALTRINEFNEQLYAVIQVNPDALHIAKTLDEQAAKPDKRGYGGPPSSRDGNRIY